MTTYSAAPPSRSVKAERRTSNPRVSSYVVDDGATISVGSPPPCGEGLGVGVGVSARAASTNDCSHPRFLPARGNRADGACGIGLSQATASPAPNPSPPQWGLSGLRGEARFCTHLTQAGHPVTQAGHRRSPCGPHPSLLPAL